MASVARGYVEDSVAVDSIGQEGFPKGSKWPLTHDLKKQVNLAKGRIWGRGRV